MTLRELPPHPDYREPEPFAGPDNPMRQLTRAMAFREPWTDEDAQRVAALFDGLAPEWAERQVNPDKSAPILDALERGNAPTDARWIELGSGTGAGHLTLADRVHEHASFDLSAEMLAHAPAGSPRVQADSSMLPLADDTADVVLLINMILFPDEVDRILRPGGTIVWINTKGDQTPIHLPPADVVAALPGDWTGTTSFAGTGLWATLRRAD